MALFHAHVLAWLGLTQPLTAAGICISIKTGLSLTNNLFFLRQQCLKAVGSFISVTSGEKCSCKTVDKSLQLKSFDYEAEKIWFSPAVT